MNRLADIAMLSYGWRRAGLAMLAGAFAALAMPPFNLLPVLFVALPIWIWCLDGAELGHGWRRLFGPAFHIGFSFGLGYFLAALHWIGAAFFVDGGWVLAAMPFAVLGLAALLALFWGLGSALAHLFWNSGPWRLLAFTLFLTLAEFARGHLFTGFPFGLFGYALAINDGMSQLASLIGVYGLTALAIALASLPALIWPADDRALTPRLVPFFAIVVVLAGQFAFGHARLGATQLTEPSNIKLRLVQPVVPESAAWTAEGRAATMARLLTLSETKLGPSDPGVTGVSHVIWPESAMHFFLADEPEELARIARMLPLGKFLITGAPRTDLTAPAGTGDFNAVMVINDGGEVVASYDKTHLVPFGEYLPFAAFWRQLGVQQFVPGAEGWQKGDARRVLTAGAASFLPLICYEAVFSGDLGPVGEAQFLLNLTNDAWFGNSIGPAQHFAHVRLRAVEEGMALARVANSGITALVDPVGRVTARLAEGEIGIMDVTPADPLSPPLFARWRHWPLLIAGLLAFGWVWLMRRRYIKMSLYPS